VAIVDPSSGQIAPQLRQIEDVIRANATPGEAVVVMFIQPSFGQTYVVKPGDSLSSIAKTHDMTLAALEAANPQLGPLSGRNWRLIHPSEQVILPDGAAQNGFVLVSRAPAGPKPPDLIKPPSEPGHPTEFQRAQYQHALDKAKETNAARIAAWQAEAAKSVQPWQAQVISQLEKRAGVSIPPTPAPNSRMLSASLTAGLTTILISHRFSTVRRADRIVVLDNGVVVEDGSHEDLLAREGRYARMFDLQAARFVELEAGHA